MSPTIIVLISPFLSVNICFMYLFLCLLHLLLELIPLLTCNVLCLLL